MLVIAIWSVLTLVLVVAVSSCAPPDRQRAAFGWGLTGVAAAIVKVDLLRAAPQWRDTPMDAAGYALHGKAITQHLAGLPVDPVLHKLHGYLTWWAPHLGPQWLPDAPVGFGSVLGSSEWIYAFSLGLWGLLGPDGHTGAWLWNASLVGAMAGVAAALAGQLGLTTRAGHWAAGLLVLEPGLAVNAAWTLKDPSATCLAMIGLVLLCRLLHRPTPWTACALGLVLGCLGGVRYVGLLCLSAALVIAWAHLLWRRQFSARSALGLGMGALVAGMTWIGVYCAPLSPDLTCARLAIIKPLAAQAITLQAPAGERGHDPTVDQWQEEVSTQPVTSAVRAVARTLLAPYPWVAWKPGLTWDNHIELYLPGSAFWMLLLPFVLLGTGLMAQRSVKDTRALAVMTFLVLVATAYLVFFGEWSTRQRLFLQPLLMVLAALGIDALVSRWRRLPDRYASEA